MSSTLWVANDVIRLPQNLISDAGALFDSCDDVSGWTASSSPAGGTATQDTTNFKEGTGSIKLSTPSSAGYIQITKTINQVMTGNIRFWVYSYDSVEPGTMSLWAVNDVGYVNYFIMYYNAPIKLKVTPGWNLINIRTSDWSVGAGSPSWSSAMVRFVIRLNTYDSTVYSLSFDSIYTDVISQGVCCLTHDDGSLSDYTEAYAYLKTRNARATFYIIDSWVGEPVRVTWANLQEMYAAGQNICAHSDQHMATLTEAEQETVINNCVTELNTNGITVREHHFAYPYGEYNADTITAEVNTGILTGRTIKHLSTFSSYELLPFGAPYELRAMELGGTVALSTATGWVDRAKTRGEVLIINLHGLAAVGSGTTWYIDRYQALVNYCIAQNVPLVTMEDLYQLQSRNFVIPRAGA